MTSKELEQNFRDLAVYLDWYNLQLYYKYSPYWMYNDNKKLEMSFEDFKIKKAHQTGMTYLEEWRWKHKNRFNAKEK